MSLLNRDDMLFKSIVEVMKKKFKKYSSEILLLYYFVFSLDHRVKLQGFCKCLSHIGAFFKLDFTTQYNNANNKLYEVCAIDEKRFDNLRNQQTQHRS